MPRVGAVEGRGVAAPNKFVSEPFTVRFFVTGSAVGRQTLLSLVLCWLCGDSRSRLFFTQGSKFMFNLCRKGEENNIPFLSFIAKDFKFENCNRRPLQDWEDKNRSETKAAEQKQKHKTPFHREKDNCVTRKEILRPESLQLRSEHSFLYIFSLHFARRSP